MSVAPSTPQKQGTKRSVREQAKCLAPGKKHRKSSDRTNRRIPFELALGYVEQRGKMPYEDHPLKII